MSVRSLPRQNVTADVPDVLFGGKNVQLSEAVLIQISMYRSPPV